MLWVLASIFCLARAETVLRTGYVQHSPPRYLVLHQDDRQVAGGLCVDIMRVIERVDPEIRFSGDPNPMPQARMLSLLERGEIDAAFCFNKNAEREKTFLVIEPPLYEIHYKLAVRASDDVNVQSFDDIRKLGDQGVVLVNFNSASVDYLRSIGGLQIDPTGVTQEVNLRKLVNGRGRFYYRHELGLRAELAQSDFEKSVKILPVVLNKQEQYVLFSRSVNRAVVERVQRALEQLKTTGELTRIKAKYVSG